MQSNTFANNKQNGVTTHKARFEGGEPNEDWMEWCQSTAKNPFPVSFQTRSVASLVIAGWSSRLSLLSRWSSFFAEQIFFKPQRQLVMVFTVWQVELENFLVARLERIEECEGLNSGMQCDAHTGKCIDGDCAPPTA